MRLARNNVPHRDTSRVPPRGGRLEALLLGGLLVAALGCGLPPGDEEPGWERHASALSSTNGFILNGFILNGLRLEGLGSEGLSQVALDGAPFEAWLLADEAPRTRLMHYLVQCALPAGQGLTYTHPETGAVHTWRGALGLAPDWAAGQPPTEAEQQLVTACLAAHVNKYGVHVRLSLRGRDARGAPLATTEEELATYSEPEGCFFGNAFGPAPVLYVGSDRATPLTPVQSSSRACAMERVEGAVDCAPLVHVGACAQSCTRQAPGGPYTACTHGGATWRPLTTWLGPEALQRCGDGVCQPGERCGVGATADSCRLDCGRCEG